MLQKVH